jgi:hypothetical protein
VPDLPTKVFSFFIKQMGYQIKQISITVWI